MTHYGSKGGSEEAGIDLIQTLSLQVNLPTDEEVALLPQCHARLSSLTELLHWKKGQGIDARFSCAKNQGENMLSCEGTR